MQTPTQCKTLAKELMEQPDANAKVLVHIHTEKWLAELEDPNEKKLYTRVSREGFIGGMIEELSHNHSQKLSVKRQANKIMDTTDIDVIFGVHCHIQQNLAKLSDPEEKERYTRVAMEGFLVDVLETFQETGYLRFSKKARKADMPSV